MPKIKPMLCFVVMPYGERDVPTKKKGVTRKVNFDDVFDDVIKPAITSIREWAVECVRCDRAAEHGSISEKMFCFVHDADIVLADITSLNANVFYELGVRHTVAEHGTVIIRQDGTDPPFNIRDYEAHVYDPKDRAGARKKLRALVEIGLRKWKDDSPVRKALSFMRISGESRHANSSETYIYSLKRYPKRSIRIITGRIQNVIDVDIWVNTENTDMEMARYFDPAISGIIRYLGARKDSTGHVVQDTIADALTKLVPKTGHVHTSSVIETTSGELEQTHNVKRILHVASVVGQLNKGYEPIADLEACVRNALIHADANIKPRSILFPLIGAGAGGGNVEHIAERLIGEAIEYLVKTRVTSMTQVYFLAANNRALKACQHVLHGKPEVKHVP